MTKPCKNPNCPSFGKPHPNCKCEGVYFAEGGSVDLSNFDALQDDSAKETKAPLMFDQLKDDSHSAPAATLPSFDDLKDDSEKHASVGQQILTGVEGAAQGLLGPLAPYIETKLGVDAKDIAGRAKANPYTHGIAEGSSFAGSMLLGVGEAGLISKGATALSKAAGLGKMGSAILKGAIETATFTGADEITKAMLSQPGSDPEVPVSAALLHVGAAGIMGAATGGLFTLGEGLIGKGLEKLGSDNMIKKAEAYLIKLAEKGNPLGELGVSKKINEYAVKSIAWPLAEKSGTGLIGYEAISKSLTPVVEKITGKSISKANPYITDAIINALLKNEVSGLPNAIHYATQIAKGTQKALMGIEAIFKGAAGQIGEPVSESLKDQLKEFIKDGQVDQQMQNEMQAQPAVFAQGGLVTNPQPSNSFANIFPEQNTLLSSAKGRISGYLNSIRPLPNQSKLPFDEKHSDKEKVREYDRALDFAVNPLKILDRVNKGKLTPQDMKSFTAMWPECHRYLSSAMTKRIIKAQLSGEKPSYSKRQSMSLFLGAALDSTLTPIAIASAQATFAQKKMTQQNQVPQKKKKGSLDKVARSFATDDQAVQRRQQKV